ncbi:MAG: methionyl-tRNA formyltransferase [Dehalococcoidia bacterium]
MLESPRLPAMTIVFMGSPQFAVPCLRALVRAGYDIAAVYTQADKPAGRGRRPTPSPISLAARELGLTVRQPLSLRGEEEVAALAALSPQAIVVCGYGRILHQHFLEVPPKGALNVHPSLLPRHRGASPIPAAILAGDDETGVTVMLTDPGMDTGPILAQRSLPITPFDTAATLTEKLSTMAAALLLDTLPRWLAGDIEPQAQDDSRATVTPLLRKGHGAIDWTAPAADIWRQVRAYDPWPGAFTALAGQLLHIWEAWPLTSSGGAEPATVVALTPEQLAALPPQLPRQAFGVQTGDGVLVALEVQLAGRRRLTAADFLRGRRDLLGQRLLAPRQ